MRMAMGLINPTSGSVYVFGHEVQPGSPALSRIGALVEGAGFLPHLTGRENLMLFWQASGRTTEDPQLDAVLAIADLGTAADKRVRAYSQGMRQRLGIAQAMLGMPDLLMLDEPTNGLDPPQIRAMRTMMQEYAATGRTVIVSSHLLSEVEQTCSHVIVMHRGRLVTRGRVDELMAGKGNMRLEDFFIEVVGDDLTVGK
jgi:ABC-2 type transport system ATP-binding protein